MIDRDNKDIALAPLLVDHAPDDRYGEALRLWQGVPALEITEDAERRRLWLSIMAGRTEMTHTYVCVQRSDDDGVRWSPPCLVVDGSAENLRIFDQVLWCAPDGGLWFFWSQMYGFGDGDGRVGCWEIHCPDPLADAPRWTKARRVANGVMRNKPTLRRDGAWLLPIAVWHDRMRRDLNWLPQEEYSNVYVSMDSGVSFQLLGRADVPDRDADEHMLAQLSDGRLWMLVRAKYGIGQAFSSDGGRTWAQAGDSGIWGPTSRFFLRRLQSGCLLLVNHAPREETRRTKARSDLTAWVSPDDGRTWLGGLTLDDRAEVSYPDGFQRTDGRIFIAYDRERDKAREVLLASFSEEEARTGCLREGASFLRRVISRGASATRPGGAQDTDGADAERPRTASEDGGTNQ